MPSPTEISPLSLHDALPIWPPAAGSSPSPSGWPHHPTSSPARRRRASGTRRSEEHTSELQSLRHLVCRLPPRSPLFPYTTLFRSGHPLLEVLHHLPAGLTTPLLHQHVGVELQVPEDRKSTRLNSSHLGISYAVSHRDLPSFPTRRSSDLATRCWKFSITFRLASPPHFFTSTSASSFRYQ